MIEHKLSQCSNLGDLRKVIAQNEEKNAELVKQSCTDTIFLMSNIFEGLSLNGNKIEVCQPITDDEVQVFFQVNHMLQKELTGNERNEDLDKRLRLKIFLDHSTKQRNYFHSFKKYDNLNYKTCQPPRLPLKTF